MYAKDYYKILELSPSASLKEIKTAYRRLAHQYHPDKNANDPYAAAQFEIVKEAYEVLINPSKKDYYLQQRWYDQSIGKQQTTTTITPVTILKQLLDLDKYVSKIDFHRMDKEGLYTYIDHILSNETIEKLSSFNEENTNKSIVDVVIKCSHSLPYSFTKALSVKLKKIATDPITDAAINKYVQSSRSHDAWNKYKPWLMIAIVIILCFIIYYLNA